MIRKIYEIIMTWCEPPPIYRQKGFLSIYDMTPFRRIIYCNEESAKLIDSMARNPDLAYLGIRHGEEIGKLLNEFESILCGLNYFDEESTEKMRALRKRIFEVRLDYTNKTGRRLG